MRARTKSGGHIIKNIMWLLHAASKRLVSFMGDATEPYAILSHTWERDEVSFTDIQNEGVAKKKQGFRWTLQETIAPPSLILYGHDWRLIGTRFEMCTELSRITGIEVQLLKNRDNSHHYCMAQRFAWASRRLTTRIEDQAYCLLGLLGINMPLLYGEGQKAFHRLQQEVLANADRDFSVLTWDPYHPQQTSMALAPDVYCFRNAAMTEVRPGPPQSWSASWSANGLRAHLPILQTADGKLCYIELQNNIRGRFLQIRKVQRPNASFNGVTTTSDVFEVTRNSPTHHKFLSETPQARNVEVKSELRDIVLTGFRSWNHYVTLDISPDLGLMHVFPKPQWYPASTEFAYSSFVSGNPCVGTVVISYSHFADPKVFAFALHLLTDGRRKLALGWYDDIPKESMSISLLNPIKRATDQSFRFAEAAEKAALRIRKISAERCDLLPVSSCSAGSSTTMLATIANEMAYKGKAFSVCPPKNQTVIRIRTTHATNTSNDHEISDRTASRWAFDKDEQYHQYDKSLAIE
ncbi:Vegetative incompatibility protein HET-E-1 [Pseudocercospora fuligena]|uniref:Vegetative incompatibility protein HET-E-1 n=1 Tax=Pseudocercospora fuligena TaxID=685502 RepID=A0A8H6VL57_9PEZI|nr:Vegetative incompatibility protein HET-E-1 [Pseudocercospora fuligena]